MTRSVKYIAHSDPIQGIVIQPVILDNPFNDCNPASQLCRRLVDYGDIYMWGVCGGYVYILLKYKYVCVHTHINLLRLYK